MMRSVVLRACLGAACCATKALGRQRLEVCLLLFRFESGALDLAGFAVHRTYLQCCTLATLALQANALHVLAAAFLRCHPSSGAARCVALLGGPTLFRNSFLRR